MAEQITVVVGAFRGVVGAEFALPRVKEDAKSEKLKILDAGLVSRDADGKVEAKDTGDWGFGKGLLAGGAAVALATALTGPVGWGVVAGSALIAGIGAHLHDDKLADAALHDLGKGMEDNTSALILMVDPSAEAATVDILKREGATTTTRGLDADTVNRIADTYKQSQSQ
jgi:uncharacterized membrane protein